MVLNKPHNCTRCRSVSAKKAPAPTIVNNKKVLSLVRRSVAEMGHDEHHAKIFGTVNNVVCSGNNIYKRSVFRMNGTRYEFPALHAEMNCIWQCYNKAYGKGRSHYPYLKGIQRSRY